MCGLRYSVHCSISSVMRTTLPQTSYIDTNVHHLNDPNLSIVYSWNNVHRANRDGPCLSVSCFRQKCANFCGWAHVHCSSYIAYNAKMGENLAKYPKVHLIKITVWIKSKKKHVLLVCANISIFSLIHSNIDNKRPTIWAVFDHDAAFIIMTNSCQLRIKSHFD